MIDYGLSSELPKDDPRLEKYAKQREERGFDDTETWSLSTTIAKILIPRLKVFKETTVSYPMGLTPEKWNDIIQEMIDGFEEVLKQDDWDNFDYKKIERGLKMFKKYYMDLWS